MAILDKNNDGKVSKLELKNAIKEVMQEAQQEAVGGNRGKRVANTIKNLVFVKTNMSPKMKSIYLGNNTAASKFHTGNSGCDITTCHTHGLSGLRKPIVMKGDGSHNKLGMDLHTQGFEKLRKLR